MPLRDRATTASHFIAQNSTFDALTTVVLTGDAVTATDIASVFDAATLNVLSIPNQFVYFAPGANSTVDTFSMVYRMALWQNTTEFAAYVASMNGSAVWRLSLLNGSNSHSSNPRMEYDPFVIDAHCSYSEAEGYNATRDEFAREVIAYVEATYAYSFVRRVSLQPETRYGFDCLETDRDCIGETRDDLRMLFFINGTILNNKIANKYNECA